jgi:uncharacterized protein with von Willebrand factor type A (vWA) domain
MKRRHGFNAAYREHFIAGYDINLWQQLFQNPTRSKHGKRNRRRADDARWWNRVERRAKQANRTLTELVATGAFTMPDSPFIITGPMVENPSALNSILRKED